MHCYVFASIFMYSNFFLSSLNLNEKLSVCSALFCMGYFNDCARLSPTKKNQQIDNTVCTNGIGKQMQQQRSAAKPSLTTTAAQIYLIYNLTWPLASVFVIMADIVSPGMLTWDITTSTSFIFFFSAFHSDFSMLLYLLAFFVGFVYRISFQLYCINVATVIYFWSFEMASKFNTNATYTILATL